MAKVYDSILDLVGKTPLVELKRIEEKEGLQAKLIAKVESFNPAGSVKDRIAKAMIEDAEAKGLLKEGSVIIEPTSGNTGIGLAAAATVKGYRMILTMPETMSVERRNIVKAYGAEVVLTDGTKGMKGAIEKADELAKEIPNSFIAGQFVNPANPATHKKTTGPEIWEDTDGDHPRLPEAYHVQLVNDVYAVFRHDAPRQRKRPFLPFFVMAVKTPVPLVPAHPANFFRYGKIMEHDVAGLGKAGELPFYVFPPFPLRNHMHLAVHGQVDDPVPPHAGFAAPVRVDGISVNQDLHHGLSI